MILLSIAGGCDRIDQAVQFFFTLVARRLRMGKLVSMVNFRKIWPYLRRLLTVLFYLLVIWFLYLQIREIRFEELARLRIEWDCLLIGGLITLGHRFIYPLIWGSLLIGMGARINSRLRVLYRVYSDSALARYVPGKVAMLGARLVFAKMLGVGRYQATISFFVEYMGQSVVWIAVSMGVILFSERLHVLSKLMPYILIVPTFMLLVLLPPVLNRLTAIPLRLFNREASGDTKLDAGPLLMSASLHILTCLSYMFAAWFILSAVQPIDTVQDALLAAAIYPLSVVIGMAVIFAPAGLGARESIQLLALQTIVPVSIAIPMVVLHRVVELCADLVFWLSCRLWQPRLPLQNEEDQNVFTK